MIEEIADSEGGSGNSTGRIKTMIEAAMEGARGDSNPGEGGSTRGTSELGIRAICAVKEIEGREQALEGDRLGLEGAFEGMGSAIISDTRSFYTFNHK